jgi:hypothetical protein
MEHSDRAKYVTDQVALWITNDSDHIADAQRLAKEGSAHALGNFLITVVRSARPHTAPWHVAQELAANDWGRVDWHEVLRQVQD